MSTKDRDSALRIARSRARAGMEAGARDWYAIAGGFAPISERQARGFERALEDGRRPFIHPGQLTTDDAGAVDAEAA